MPSRRRRCATASVADGLMPRDLADPWQPIRIHLHRSLSVLLGSPSTFQSWRPGSAHFRTALVTVGLGPLQWPTASGRIGAATGNLRGSRTCGINGAIAAPGDCPAASIRARSMSDPPTTRFVNRSGWRRVSRFGPPITPSAAMPSPRTRRPAAGPCHRSSGRSGCRAQARARWSGSRPPPRPRPRCGRAARAPWR